MGVRRIDGLVVGGRVSAFHNNALTKSMMMGIIMHTTKTNAIAPMIVSSIVSLLCQSECTDNDADKHAKSVCCEKEQRQNDPVRPVDTHF